ncbi:hypothetical protein B4U80_14704, partial [Leptotrombidium deliense]
YKATNDESIYYYDFNAFYPYCFARMGRKGEKHSSLTLSQKQQLHRKSEAEPLTQQELADCANSKFVTSIKRATVCLIMRKLQKKTNNISGSCKRCRRVNFPELDSMLEEWCLRFQDKAVISDVMIVEKEKQFAHQMKIDENAISFSNGWLRSFKDRK